MDRIRLSWIGCEILITEFESDQGVCVEQPVILDQQGKEQDGPCEGYLCIKKPWPGIARSLYGDHKRFEETYFRTWLGMYVTGDGCRRDADGYITLTGRIDDVVNVR